MIWKAPILAWCDLETTNLDPATGDVLEVGIVITGDRLNELASFSKVIGHDVEALDMSEYVREMHTKSGLLEEVQARFDGGEHTLYGVTVAAIEWFLGVPWPRNEDMHNLVSMAGSKPNFDRGWLQGHMPKLSRLFHYREFDMNTLYYFFNLKKPKDEAESVHRALPDIRGDLIKLRGLYNRIPTRLWEAWSQEEV